MVASHLGNIGGGNSQIKGTTPLSEQTFEVEMYRASRLTSGNQQHGAVLMLLMLDKHPLAL